MARVTERFESGKANYGAGHLAAARRDFDDAVDWILESGYDPNSDPKLHELFQQVTDTVYAYELQAFRAGDGFSALTIGVGVQLLHLPNAGFFAFTVGLVVIWLLLSLIVVRDHSQLVAKHGDPPAGGAVPLAATPEPAAAGSA